MSCPLCGDVCRCHPENYTGDPGPPPRSRFDPDAKVRLGLPDGASAGSVPAPRSVTQQGNFFTHSRRTTFAVDGGKDCSRDSEEASIRGGSPGVTLAEPVDNCVGNPSFGPRCLQTGDSASSGALSSWRREVTARVRHYHSRRKPRAPKYPSLRLKFDSNEPEWISSAAPGIESYGCVSRQAVAENVAPSSSPGVSKRQLTETAYREAAIREAVGKIIEFPRSISAPVRLDELAEPVLDQLRILDVPEVSPPPPALGGILIEPEEKAEVEKRPGFDVPLQAASLGRRTLAGAVDGLVVLFAAWLFGYVFHRVTVFRPLLLQLAAGMAVLTALLWTAYQYLFVVHSAHTLGLRLTRLQLNRFDGAPADRHLRRWRVAASVLSAISLGMGYAWCFLDEDSLCWHDRITRTYLGPSSNEPKSSTAPKAGPARGRV